MQGSTDGVRGGRSEPGRLYASPYVGLAPEGLEALFNSDDLTGVGRTTRIIESLAERDRKRFDSHRRTLADLATSRTTLESRQVESASLREAARAARIAVDGAIDSQTSLIAEIDARRDLTAQLTGQLEAARARHQSRSPSGRFVSS